MSTDNFKEDCRQAIERCIQGLGFPWNQSNAHQIDCVPLNLGRSNRLVKCTLNDESVIVRFYGSELTGKGNKFKSVSEGCEAVIVHKLGELQLGPTVLALFGGGRIETYLPSRCLLFEEYRDAKFASVIARKLARVHQLQMPLPQPSSDFIFKQMQQLSQTVQSNEQLKSIPSDIRTKHAHEIDALLQFDFDQLIETIHAYQQRIESRIVFTHNDLNRSNILLLDEPFDFRSSTRIDSCALNNRLLIMDFEYCAYGFRWADISTYFQEIAFDQPETKSSSSLSSASTIDCIAQYPNEKFRTNFFRHYLDEWQSNQSNDFDSSLMDTIDQLELECKFGALCVNLIRILWTLAHPKINNERLALWTISYDRLQMLLAQLDQFSSSFD